ncbi:ABC transporter ATP-binding protein [Peribacillus castrilensis]|uniref:ABC transporter n=1 Tax=Peribacillus simplex TaxID=1478 RepID=A0AAN2PGQ7_9BACI|nr:MULTISPECIES: ABC transporter ATP-binding protein [Bacillaceae]MCF7622259.1 ABC transporter ATP-binding protein/permease [Peribacillus frigoritolerans]MCT1388886.1 ABC transporter ATP-binding protein/permease [Peribacillus frigoritolerans]MEA3574835.1 ABC transporter ATP-binding protein [Peribacillus frigoritolerans]NCT38630.1 ABC transporter ATP-binding protein [Peribacillus frigoritolerans]PRA78374.1 ABC transporter ATP-binding protein [Peribacillus simplex]
MSNQKKPQGGGQVGHGPGGGNMMMMGQKAKDFKGTLKRLLTYLKPRRNKLISVFFAAIMSTIFMIVGPKIMGNAITELFEGAYGKFQGIPGAAINFDKIGQILLLLAGLYALSSLFNYVQQYIMSSVAQDTVYDLREDVNKKLEKLPLKYFEGRPNGETLSRMTNDIDTIGSTLQQSLTQFITSIVTIVGIIIMMLSISPLLTLISIISLPLSIFAIRPILKRSQKHFADQQRKLGQLNGHIEEIYTGHQVVKAFGYEKKASAQFTEVNEGLYKAGSKAQFISGIIMPVMFFIGNLSYVIISVVGGILVTQRSISIGDIQAFITYSKQFTQPITQTANIANIIQSTVAAAERVFELLDEEEEMKEQTTVNIKRANGAVSFEHVDFGYGEEMLIEDMNIDVLPGQTVAIVGPTGAGKTTMINLLMRFYELIGGKITIDGLDTRNMSRNDLRKNFGMVLQDTWLFNGTINENIAYGKNGATDEEIFAAARTAHADHFIRTLPDGYETILNEEASNISQGQKQLLTIARAVLADPPIMILDEATSSVDTRTEVFIQKAMNRLMEGRTSFVIAHRLSTIKDADLILVMDQGKVIEKGTHSDLLRENGFYAELYNSQFTENVAG